MRLVCAGVGHIDPAIDLDAMGASALDEYRKTSDAALLKFKPNAKPCWFICDRGNGAARTSCSSS